MELTQLVAHMLHSLELTDQTLVVGVSGGADSLCLLHILHTQAAALNLTLHVATLDHGLRGAAGAADAAYVAAVAQALGWPVHQGQEDVHALATHYGLGIEDAARRARYRFLANVAQTVGAAQIAVAHTADDQAETILMHILRGSGLAGLRGMQPCTPLSADHGLPGQPPPAGLHLVRPLLEAERSAIDAYCAAHGLQPRTDVTNQDPAFLRNRLRHEIMPLLAAINPQVRQALRRTSQLVTDDYALLHAYTDQLWQALLMETGSQRLAFDRAAFRAETLTPAARRMLLRRAAHHLAPQAEAAGFAAIAQALDVAQHGPTGSQSTLPGGVLVRVLPDRLLLHTPGAALHPEDRPWVPAGTDCAVPVPGRMTLPGTPWALHTRWLHPDEDAATLRSQPHTATLALPTANAALRLRTRQPGDRWQPLGMHGRHQKLSDTLINEGIPAPERQTLPILSINDQIAWVGVGPQGRVSQRFAVQAGVPHRIVVYWQKQM